MKLSLKDFRKRFHDELYDIHWSQWTALGVQSHIRPERKWIIDLEALTISTLALGLEDKRLLSSSFEWLVKFGEWINVSRMKRIGSLYTKTLPDAKTALLLPRTFDLFLNQIKKITRNKILFHPLDGLRSEQRLIKEYQDIFGNFKLRNIVIKPKLKDPSLLQLLLRGVFGVDAHVEVFIYLLTHESGNSNAIAREVYYNQKNIHNILERWTQAQIVNRVQEKKASFYSLARKKQLVHGIGLKELPRYLNWTKTFWLLNRVAKSVADPRIAEDEYLLASRFRDFLNEARPVGKALNVAIPDPASFPGREYFAPFALTLLKLLKALK